MKATRSNARPSMNTTTTTKRAADPWQFNTRSINRTPAPAQPIQPEEDDSLISNSEFDEIMSILKKNRS